MKIYKSLWAGYDNYFVKIGSAWSSRNEPAETEVLSVNNAGGEWNVSLGQFYSLDLKDAEHYSVVGTIELKRLIIDAFLSAVGKERKEENIT